MKNEIHTMNKRKKVMKNNYLERQMPITMSRTSGRARAYLLKLDIELFFPLVFGFFVV